MSNRLEWPELTKSITSHFENEIEKIIDVIVKNSINDLSDKIREKTGSIAAKILNGFDYTQDQNRLVITVNFNELKK